MIATEQLKTLPDRMSTCQTNLAHLIELIDDYGLPLQPVPLPGNAVRGWYGTPFTMLTPVCNPAALLAAFKQAGLPVRNLYPDWLSTPLLREPRLLERLTVAPTASRGAPTQEALIGQCGQARRLPDPLASVRASCSPPDAVGSAACGLGQPLPPARSLLSAVADSQRR